MKHTLWVLLFCTFFFAGCSSHKYNTVRLYPDQAPSKLSPGGKVYIALPEPGKFADRVFEKSGMMTADAIQKALTRYIKQVEIGTSPEALDHALSSARNCGARYLIVANIQHWEERATDWSGRPDKITVKITIVDTDSGDPIDTVEINGKSRRWTFRVDHPQDLLPKPINDYFDSMFKSTTTAIDGSL